MDKPFDSSLKLLQKIGPHSYAKLLGIKTRKADYKDTDLSTVSSASDCVLMVGDDEQTAEHIENQSSYDATMGERCLVYNVLARKSLGVPVNSTVLLLCPEADGPAMNGIVRRSGRNGVQNLEFRFDVVRLWTLPAEHLFECGLGVLPLAFIGDIKEAALPALVRRTATVLERRRLKRGDVAEIWTTIKILMGLRYKESFVDELLTGVKEMKESVTYQAILKEGEAKGEAKGEARGEARGEAKGEAKEARSIALRLATKKLGPPNAKTLAAFNAIKSLNKIEDLAERVLFVASWDELLRR